MAAKKYLVMVDVKNNNYKYYQMEAIDGELVVSFGRMGGKAQTARYPLSEWDRKFDEKIKKGYKDMSDIYLVEKPQDDQTARIMSSQSDGQQLYNALLKYTHDFLHNSLVNYKTSINEKMVTLARGYLADMYKAKTVDQFNESLSLLIEISPRMVKNVEQLMAKTKEDFAQIIEREEDLIDAMEVILDQEKTKNEALEEARKTALDIEELPEDFDMFDLIGIDVWEATYKQKEDVMKHLSDMLKPKVKKIYRVINHRHKDRFNKYIEENGITEVKQLFHGSRNENWLSIVDKGLMLKPNAIITGKMFGNGIYFAPSSMKSWNYTSYHGTYWANGTDSIAYMGLYATAYGKPYNIDDWSSEDYEKSVKSGKYDCLHAHAGKSLKNDEIVFYTEDAILLNYIIEFGD